MLLTEVGPESFPGQGEPVIRRLNTCDVHFDLSLGEWTIEQAWDGTRSSGIQKDERSYFCGKARETLTGTAVAIAHNIADRDVRVVVIGQDGRQRLPKAASAGGAGHLKGIDLEFDDAPVKIREYQLQSRPVGRYDIKYVVLQPAKVGG